MDGATVQIVGLKELDAKLTELGTTAAARIIREGLRAGGQVMQEAVEERAEGLVKSPYRGPATTALPLEALASDIELRLGRDEAGLPAAIVGPGKFTRRVARWVEYGHRLVKGGYSSRKRGKLQGPGTEIGEVPAYPFIRPGYEASAAPAAGLAIEKMKEGVEKAAAKR